MTRTDNKRPAITVNDVQGLVRQLWEWAGVNIDIVNVYTTSPMIMLYDYQSEELTPEPLTTREAHAFLSGMLKARELTKRGAML